jgi:hypothetical protein
MAFESYIPKAFGPGEKLADDQCSLSKAGVLTLTIPAADALHIKGRVHVLVDKSTHRLGIRAPRPGEPTLAVRVIEFHFPAKQGHTPPSPRTVRINCAGAIKAMGIDPAKVAGRRALQRKEPDLGIIQVAAPGGK